jgi:peptidyl-prolyl cis-trans isomerase B (cyclophilin B)
MYRAYSKESALRLRQSIGDIAALRPAPVIAVLLSILAGAAFCAPRGSAEQDTPAAPDARSTSDSGERSDTNNSRDNRMQEVAVLSTPHGEIVIRFFPDLAPKHVESFKKLAGQGFYDGTSFHRVIPGFMIQGGDPNSKDAENRMAHGTGGPGYQIPAEFSDHKHTRGTVSAARSQDPDSAGSQFFICVADSPWLDGQYTVFGEVVSGMDAADRVVAEPRDPRDNPLQRMEIQVKLEERNL